MDPRAGLDGGGKSRFHRDFFYFICTFCPGFAFSPLLYDTYNTNFHASGGFRTRNPSKRSAADPRLRPLGHWDRRIRFPGRPARSESQYRLSYRGRPAGKGRRREAHTHRRLVVERGQ